MSRLNDFAVQARVDATHPLFQKLYLYAADVLAAFPSAMVFPEDFLPFKEIYHVEILDGTRDKKAVVRKKILHTKKHGGIFRITSWSEFQNSRYWARHDPNNLNPNNPNTTTGHTVLRDAGEIVSAEHGIVAEFQKTNIRTNWMSGDIIMPNREGAASLFEIVGYRAESWRSQNGHLYLGYAPTDKYNNCPVIRSAMFSDKKDAAQYAAIQLMEILK